MRRTGRWTQMVVAAALCTVAAASGSERRLPRPVTVVGEVGIVEEDDYGRPRVAAVLVRGDEGLEVYRLRNQGKGHLLLQKDGCFVQVTGFVEIDSYGRKWLAVSDWSLRWGSAPYDYDAAVSQRHPQ